MHGTVPVPRLLACLLMHYPALHPIQILLQEVSWDLILRLLWWGDRPAPSTQPDSHPGGWKDAKNLVPRQRQGSARGRNGGGFSCPCLLSDHVTEAHLVPGANPVLHWEGVSGCLFEELL